MEIWMLDRGIRWGEGSKAKRSKLLNNTAGLFQASSFDGLPWPSIDLAPTLPRTSYDRSTDLRL